MTRVFNTIAIVILALVIILMILWRASTNHLTYWLPIDYIGIIGFGMTLFTAWKVYFMNQDIQVLSSKYSMKLALPGIKKRLEKTRKDLMKINMPDDDLINYHTDLSGIIGTCLSECKELNQKMATQDTDSQTTKEIMSLCHEIKSGKRVDKSDIFKLHICLTELVEDVDKMLRELNNEVSL